MSFSFMQSSWWKRQFEEDGGINEVMLVALPIAISQSADSVMMFVSRYFLSGLGKDFPAAAMAGGMSAFMFTTPFTGLVGYTTVLVAQYFGAKQYKNCSLVLTQAILISLLVYPLIVFLGMWLGPHYFAFLGLKEHEVGLSLRYFHTMIFATIFNLMRMCLSGFFSGIGQTRIVMLANMLGMIAAIPLSYAFIHGNWGAPKMGLDGAALAVVVANLLSVLVLLSSYLSVKNWDFYFIKKSFRGSVALLRKFFIYGAPSGTELMLNFFAFNTFVNLFHSYGPDEAAAMTIAFNWDILAVMPVWGLNVGIMSLVGKSMGAENVETAVRSTFSGLKSAYFFMILAAIFFFSFTESLVGVFIPKGEELHFQNVLNLGVVMLRMVSIYCLANATALVFGAALRGAGDTRWCMFMSVTTNWAMLIIAYLCIRVWGCTPVQVWCVFISMLFCLASAYTFRFFQGKWKVLRVIDK